MEELTENGRKHIPVMLPEVLEVMAARDDEVIVDATFGAGGYSRALLESARCKVVAIDRDPNTVMLAEALAREFPGHFFFINGQFGDMARLLPEHGFNRVDGVIMDIGVSSMQIDEGERGFSFQADGPLDMRMSQTGESAADIINTYEEADLEKIFRTYGEEKQSRRMARTIGRHRAKTPITTTKQLADIASEVLGGAGKKMKIHPATRIFQALRIVVNDELGELERGLAGATEILNEGGRLGVVTFHSLEDRIAKKFMREQSGEVGTFSRHMPEMAEAPPPPLYHVKERKSRKASESECAINGRSRSAQLRYAVRSDVPYSKGEAA